MRSSWYIPMIRYCVNKDRNGSQLGKIGFLTVDERDDLLDEGEAGKRSAVAEPHRRGRLHTDSPGVYLPHVVPSWTEKASRVVQAESAAAGTSNEIMHKLKGKTCKVQGEVVVPDLAEAAASLLKGKGKGNAALAELLTRKGKAAELAEAVKGRPFLLRPGQGVPEQMPAFHRFRMQGILSGRAGRDAPIASNQLELVTLIHEELSKNVFDDLNPDAGQGLFGVNYHHWGIGMVRGTILEGGIYCCSTVDDTCEVFNCTVDDPRLIGHLGDCEHLRPLIDEGSGGRKLKAGEMCWLTDRTPHESLPLPAGSGRRRQFFRLVTSEVGLWYKAHSTANPLCGLDTEKTVVLEGSKFLSRAGVVG